MKHIFILLLTILTFSCTKQESREDLITYHKAEVENLLRANNISEELINLAKKDIESVDLETLISWKIQNELSKSVELKKDKARSCDNYVQVIVYPGNSFSNVEVYFKDRNYNCAGWFQVLDVNPYVSTFEFDMSELACDDDVYTPCRFLWDRPNPYQNLLTWTTYFQCDCNPVDQDYKYINQVGYLIEVLWTFFPYDYCDGTAEGAVKFVSMSTLL